MALQIITPGVNTGYNAVGTDDYRAGQVAARATDGTVVVSGGGNDVGSGTKPIGIFGEDRLTTTLQQTAQFQESITLPNDTTTTVALSHDNLAGAVSTHALSTQSSEVVQDATTPATIYVNNTDYTLDTVLGTIKAKGVTTPGKTILISYTYKLNDQFEKDFRGVNYKGSLDDSEGSKKTTVWSGWGEYKTDQFATDVVYAIGDPLRTTIGAHVAGKGLLTNEASGATVAAKIVGYVVSLPTAANPLLGFAFTPTAGTVNS